jgi:predicted nucleic acid-binding protein
MKKLSDLPRNAPIFIDTNILVLAGGEGRLAQQCRDFLNRVRQREVAGFTATFVAAEVTHRVMVKEARERLGLSSAETVEYLQRHPDMVRTLSRHLQVASDIGKANIDILPLMVKDLHASKMPRREYGLLTNDSLIVAVMRNHKLRHLATYDSGFLRVSGLEVWMPEAQQSG